MEEELCCLSMGVQPAALKSRSHSSRPRTSHSDSARATPRLARKNITCLVPVSERACALMARYLKF